MMAHQTEQSTSGITILDTDPHPSIESAATSEPLTSVTLVQPIDKQVQQRWKTAQNAYVRCKAALKNVPSGSGGNKRKTYVYFECMKFLDNKQESNTEDSILPNQAGSRMTSHGRCPIVR